MVWDWGWPTTLKLFTKRFTFKSKPDYITLLNFIGDFRLQCNLTLNEVLKKKNGLLVLKSKGIQGPASLSLNLRNIQVTCLVWVRPILSDVFEESIDLDVGGEAVVILLEQR